MVINPTPIASTYTTTYIKFGSAPTDQNDYDAFNQPGIGVYGISSYSNQTSVWVWGNSLYKGQVKINDVLYVGGATFNTAIQIQLTGNYDIALGRGNNTGGSN